LAELVQLHLWPLPEALLMPVVAEELLLYLETADPQQILAVAVVAHRQTPPIHSLVVMDLMAHC
jgi:hypothetical protein